MTEVEIDRRLAAMECEVRKLPSLEKSITEIKEYMDRVERLMVKMGLCPPEFERTNGEEIYASDEIANHVGKPMTSDDPISELITPVTKLEDLNEVHVGCDRDEESLAAMEDICEETLPSEQGETVRKKKKRWKKFGTRDRVEKKQGSKGEMLWPCFGYGDEAQVPEGKTQRKVNKAHPTRQVLDKMHKRKKKTVIRKREGNKHHSPKQNDKITVSGNMTVFCGNSKIDNELFRKNFKWYKKKQRCGRVYLIWDELLTCNGTVQLYRELLMASSVRRSSNSKFRCVGYRDLLLLVKTVWMRKYKLKQKLNQRKRVSVRQKGMRLATAKTSERAEWKHRYMGYGRLSSLVMSVGKKPTVKHKHHNKKKRVTEMLSDEQFALIWNSCLEPAMIGKKFRVWCKRSHCKEACLCREKMPFLRTLVKQNDKVLSSKIERRDKSKQGCVNLVLLVIICLNGMIGAKLLVGNQGVEKQYQNRRKRDTFARKYIGRKVKFRIVRKKWCVQQLHGLLVAIFRGKKITWVEAFIRNHEGRPDCKYKRKKGSELLCISSTLFSAKIVSADMERKIWPQRQKNTKEGRRYNCLWDHKIWLLKITQQKKKKIMIKARPFATFTRRRAVSMFKYGGQKESISLVTVDLAESLLGRKDHKVQRDIDELLSWKTMETVARYGVAACRVTQEYEDSTLDSGYNMILGGVIAQSKHAQFYGRKQHHIGWVKIRYPLRIAEGGEGIVRQVEFTLPNYGEDAKFTGGMVEDAVKRNRQRELHENLFDLAVIYVLFGAPRPPEQSVIAKSFRSGSLQSYKLIWILLAPRKRQNRGHIELQVIINQAGKNRDAIEPEKLTSTLRTRSVSLGPVMLCVLLYWIKPEGKTRLGPSVNQACSREYEFLECS